MASSNVKRARQYDHRRGGWAFIFENRVECKGCGGVWQLPPDVKQGSEDKQTNRRKYLGKKHWPGMRDGQPCSGAQTKLRQRPLPAPDYIGREVASVLKGTHYYGRVLQLHERPRYESGNRGEFLSQWLVRFEDGDFADYNQREIEEMLSTFACMPAVVMDYDTLVAAQRSSTMAAAQTSGAHAVVETLHEEGSGEDDEDGDAEQGYAFDGFDNDLEEVAWEDWEALEAEADEGDFVHTDLSLPVAENTEVNVFTHLITLLTEAKGQHPISNLAVTSRLRHDIRVYRARVPKTYATAIRMLKVENALRLLRQYAKPFSSQ